jgi:hypothetical protein
MVLDAVCDLALPFSGGGQRLDAIFGVSIADLIELKRRVPRGGSRQA